MKIVRLDADENADQNDAADDFLNGSKSIGFSNISAGNSAGNDSKRVRDSAENFQTNFKNPVAKKPRARTLDEQIAAGAVLKISKISAAVKTPGRYNIFVNQIYAFSLDELQLVEIGLKVGAEISPDDLAKFKNESAFGKNYVRAVDLISRRARSEKELRDYARRKMWTDENTERVVARLKSRGYLNDAKFAAGFVRSRANLKTYSRRRMILELRKKGISSEIIDSVLADGGDYDELEALKKLVRKRRARYDDPRKFTQYLLRQGFRYDDVKKVLEGDENSDE
ncbi:MAG: RecX family transcriptional regulator [Candidatus Nomurabacteria bacterium]|jgi:regulatory protein|nr:RecX family transcriptional regulator [Candidatus Nomurabacteria bacterium]